MNTLFAGKRRQTNIKEMTVQEMELSRLYTAHGSKVKDRNAIFQKFVSNCPEALNHLLDRCMIDDGEENQRKGKIYLDLFLFKSSNHLWESELSIANLLFSGGKNRLFEHALFEVFIQMKWMKVRNFFTLGILFHALYMLIVIGFTLVNFSNILEKDTMMIQQDYWWCSLSVGNVFLCLGQVLKMIHFWTRIFKNRQRITKITKCERWADLHEFLSIIHCTATPILGFLALYTMSRYVTACLVLYTGWHFLLTTPTMTAQVMRTIAGLGLAYSPQILSFAIAFHILLPDSVAFG